MKRQAGHARFAVSPRGGNGSGSSREGEQNGGVWRYAGESRIAQGKPLKQDGHQILPRCRAVAASLFDCA